MAINGKPTVISLFAGTGGSSLGYKWAGYHELLAIDLDSHAIECFKLNFPEVPIWQRSVSEVTGQEILEFCGIEKGELDVLDGSPPCQGFSTAGRREVRDPRNDLFKHYVRLVNELSPKVFVMENVSGMAKGGMKGRFIEIISALKATGYSVKVKQMNAVNYGVPQSRERLIFIGCREPKEPTFPMPHGSIVSVGIALSNIRNNPMDTSHLYKKGEVRKIIEAMKPGEDGCDAYQRIFKTKKRKWFGLKRLESHKPGKTIIKRLGSAHIHPTENRVLSITEAKVLCSFPEDFKLVGSTEKKWARLGNAVMPKFMQAIAEHIKKELL